MRGGARVGAGRKPFENPRKRLVLYVTDDERESLEKLLAKLRHDDTQPTLIDLTYQVEEYKTAQEPAEITPTIATPARIMEIERLNYNVPRGKWECIAGILNKAIQYDEALQPWTASSVKKAFLKARKQAQA